MLVCRWVEHLGFQVKMHYFLVDGNIERNA